MAAAVSGEAALRGTLSKEQEARKAMDDKIRAAESEAIMLKARCLFLRKLTEFAFSCKDLRFSAVTVGGGRVNSGSRQRGQGSGVRGESGSSRCPGRCGLFLALSDGFVRGECPLRSATNLDAHLVGLRVALVDIDRLEREVAAAAEETVTTSRQIIMVIAP